MRILWADLFLVALVVVGAVLDLLSTVNASIWKAFSLVPGGGIKPVEGFEEDRFYSYVFALMVSIAGSIVVVWGVLKLATAIRSR